MSGIGFTQDYLVYKPKKEGVYPLTESDWRRLKSLITKIIPEKKIYSIISSVAFGAFVSSVFSLISLSDVKNLSSWIIPTYWSILFGSLTIGISLFILDRQQKAMITITSNFILQEMTVIENKYEKSEESE